MMAQLRVVPVTLRQANDFVGVHHRHSGRRQGHKASIGAAVDGRLVGVAILSMPSGRGLNGTATAEVARLCTDGTRNACSFLYGAAARLAASLGFARLVTYTLETETGASLRAAGFEFDGRLWPRSWDCEGRPRGGDGSNSSPGVARLRWFRDLRTKRGSDVAPPLRITSAEFR